MTFDLPLWAALPAALLLIVGGLTSLTGAIGLLRLRDFYSRMHPPTMGTTLGTGCVLIASMIVSSAITGRPVLHEILLTMFIVTTTPITAILLMRAALYRGKARLTAADADADMATETANDPPATGSEPRSSLPSSD